MTDVPFYCCDDKTPDGIHYGFFGKQGGISTGLYDSLNCGFGSDDDSRLVQTNRAHAITALGFTLAQLAGVYQYHSAEVVTITDRAHIADRPRADGLVTALPNVALGILTADCTPLLFYAQNSPIIGACHAGWRGAAAGVIQNTITAMTSLGAELDTINCLIGPTIAQASYQIGNDMRDEVLRHAPHAESFFAPCSEKPDHFRFDLPAFAAACAKIAGLQHIYDIGRDTYGESSYFFSHRRATHLGQSDTGRQIAIIATSHSEG